MGKTGIYRDNIEKKVTYASYLVRLRVKNLYISEYVNYLLNSSNFITFARSQAYKSINQANLNPTRYGYLMIAYPGEASEQQSIVDYITARINLINSGIDKIQNEIELITDYRTSLISDVVTGKVDVRHIEIDDIIEEDTEIDEAEDEVAGMEEILDNDEE